MSSASVKREPHKHSVSTKRTSGLASLHTHWNLLLPQWLLLVSVDSTRMK